MEFFTSKQQKHNNNNNNDAKGSFFPAVDNIQTRLPLLQSVDVHAGEPQGSDMWLMFLMLRPLLLHWSLLSARRQMDVWDEWGEFRNLAPRAIFFASHKLQMKQD